MSKRKDLPAVPALDGKAAKLFASNGERLAAVLSRPSANFPGMRPGAQRAEDDDEIATLAGAALKAASDGGKVAKHALERVDALQANLQSVEQTIARLSNGGLSVGSFAPQSIGASVRQRIEGGEADAFRAMSAGNTSRAAVRLDTSIKAILINDGSGSSSDLSTVPGQPGFSGIFGPVARPLTLLDVLPIRPVSADAVDHVRLGTSGDAAEQENEGDEKSEVEFSGEAVRTEIATVAAISHASRQVLGDVIGLAAVIDTTLRSKVLARLENQVLNGPGGAGRIEGILNLAAVHAPTATTPADRLGEAVAGLAADGYQPNVIALHPSDWFRIVSERGGDEHYTLGQPTAPLAPVIWGCRVVTSASMPEGRALVLDTRFSTVLDRERIDVQASEHHDRNFTRNLVTLRAELRAGLEFTDVDSAWTFDLEDAASSS